MNLKERANQLKNDIPAVLLALKAKETPLPAKIFAAVTVAYALSPVDLIPDVIPVLGYLDDVLLLPTFIAITIKMIPSDVFDKYRRQAEGMWADGSEKHWYYALPIVIVWLIIIGIIIRIIWS